MLFARKEASAHRFTFFNSSPSKSPPASARSFEAALTARLADLLLETASLSWLSRAVRLLARTLNDATALLTDDLVSSSDCDVLADYLHSSVALLELCVTAASEIDRLHMRFALHILASSDGRLDAETLRKARDSLEEWTVGPRRALKPSLVDLVKSLAPANPPKGKISVARRVIYAVQAVTSLIVGVLVAALGGSEPLPAVRVPSDLPWAKEYHDLTVAISSLPVGDWFAAELDAAIKNLTDGISTNREDKTETLRKSKEDPKKATGASRAAVKNYVFSTNSEDKTETLRKSMEDTKKATGALTEGLDELSNAVNGLFQSALGLRNAALQGFRVGSCK